MRRAWFVAALVVAIAALFAGLLQTSIGFTWLVAPSFEVLGLGQLTATDAHISLIGGRFEARDLRYRSPDRSLDIRAAQIQAGFAGRALFETPIRLDSLRAEGVRIETAAPAAAIAADESALAAGAAPAAKDGTPGEAEGVLQEIAARALGVLALDTALPVAADVISLRDATLVVRETGGAISQLGPLILDANGFVPGTSGNFSLAGRWQTTMARLPGETGDAATTTQQGGVRATATLAIDRTAVLNSWKLDLNATAEQPAKPLVTLTGGLETTRTSPDELTARGSLTATRTGTTPGQLAGQVVLGGLARSRKLDELGAHGQLNVMDLDLGQLARFAPPSAWLAFEQGLLQGKLRFDREPGAPLHADAELSLRAATLAVPAAPVFGGALDLEATFDPALETLAVQTLALNVELAGKPRISLGLDEPLTLDLRADDGPAATAATGTTAPAAAKPVRLTLTLAELPLGSLAPLLAESPLAALCRGRVSATLAMTVRDRGDTIDLSGTARTAALSILEDGRAITLPDLASELEVTLHDWSRLTVARARLSQARGVATLRGTVDTSTAAGPSFDLQADTADFILRPWLDAFLFDPGSNAGALPLDGKLTVRGDSERTLTLSGRPTLTLGLPGGGVRPIMLSFDARLPAAGEQVVQASLDSPKEPGRLDLALRIQPTLGRLSRPLSLHARASGVLLLPWLTLAGIEIEPWAGPLPVNGDANIESFADGRVEMQATERVTFALPDKQTPEMLTLEFAGRRTSAGPLSLDLHAWRSSGAMPAKESELSAGVAWTPAAGTTRGRLALQATLDRVDLTPWVRPFIDPHRATGSASPGATPLRAAAGASATPSAVTRPADPLAPDLDLSLQVRSTRYRQVEIGALTGHLDRHSGVMAGRVDSAAFAEGKLAAELRLGAGENDAMHFTAKGSKIRLEPLMDAFAGSRRIDGRLDLDVTGASESSRGPDLFDRLDGRVTFDVSDGRLEGFAVLGALARATGVDAFTRLAFSSFGGEALVRDGRLDIRHADAGGDLTNVKAKGTVDLRGAGAWDVVLTPHVGPSLARRLGRPTLIGDVLEGAEGMLALPVVVQIEGPLAEPRFVTRTQSVRDLIGDHGGNAVGGALDAVTGGRAGRAFDALTGGLFRDSRARAKPAPTRRATP